LEALSELFVQALRLCKQARLVGLGTLALDGTKLRANDERFGCDRRGDELPEELQRREGRLERIREAKQALEAEAREAQTARRAELQEQGKKPRRPPNGRDPFAPTPKRAARLHRRAVEDHEDL
jgi:hypothetical protein